MLRIHKGYCVNSMNNIITLRRLKFYIKLSSTSEVIEGHIMSPFHFKNTLFIRYIFWLESNLIKTLYES